MNRAELLAFFKKQPPEQWIQTPVEAAVSAQAAAEAAPIAGNAKGTEAADNLQRPAKLVEPTPKAASLLDGFHPYRKPALAAAAVLAAAGFGFAVAEISSAPDHSAEMAAARWNDAAASSRAAREEMLRLGAEMKTVKLALVSLKSERDRTHGELSTKQTQAAERLAGETSTRIGKLSEQIDRIEKYQRDPSRIQVLVDRLDRMEKQVVAAATPAPTPPPKPIAALAAPQMDVTQTGSIGDARPVAKTQPEIDPRKLPLDGYAIRDIDDGVALIETKTGRFLEVAVGQLLPGIGRVESIERRGRQWVVVTSKGFIGERWN